MPASDDKGKFETDIASDVIAEALKSVKKHTGGAAEPEVSVELEAAPAAAASEPPPAPATAEAAEGSKKEFESLKAQLDFSMAKGRELMDKVKESHERMLRAVADLENYRKRAQKEKEEVQKFGLEKLLKEILPVADNLDRALEHTKSAADFDSLLKGITMTRKLFDDIVGKHGLRGFKSVGKPFDPRMHEAMQSVETTAMPPNHVAHEVVRGYTLNDRLIRPALVMISKAAATAAPVGGEPTPGETGAGPPAGVVPEGVPETKPES